MISTIWMTKTFRTSSRRLEPWAQMSRPRRTPLFCRPSRLKNENSLRFLKISSLFMFDMSNNSYVFALSEVQFNSSTWNLKKLSNRFRLFCRKWAFYFINLEVCMLFMSKFSHLGWSHWVREREPRRVPRVIRQIRTTAAQGPQAAFEQSRGAFLQVRLQRLGHLHPVAEQHCQPGILLPILIYKFKWLIHSAGERGRARHFLLHPIQLGPGAFLHGQIECGPETSAQGVPMHRVSWYAN